MYPWNIKESIKRLNSLINGTGYYWRIGTNKRIFTKLDNFIYNNLLRQAKRWHPKKSTKWVVNKYFKESLLPNHKDNWIFTDPNSEEQVDKMAWIRIRYHRCIKYKATPYDSEYDDYLTKYKSKTPFQCLFD